MGCIINSGNAIGCYGSAGIKAFYIGNYNQIESSYYTYDSDGEMTGMTSASTVSYYTFEVEEGSATFSEKSKIENGAVAYEQSCSITLFNTTAAIKNQLLLLSKARLSVLIEDWNGNFHLMGAENGVRTTEVDGGVLANGFKITFRAMEPKLTTVVDQAAVGFTLIAN